MEKRNEMKYYLGDSYSSNHLKNFCLYWMKGKETEPKWEDTEEGKKRYDRWRALNDLDCLYFEGDLRADTLMSAWTPIKWVADYFNRDCGMIFSKKAKEDHQRRVERYEAYQAYRKYYKEIMDVIVNFEGYPDYTSGGAPFLKKAILKEVPQITERQLTLVWRDLPIVLEKRTQDVIEMERQNSMVQLQKIENGGK